MRAAGGGYGWREFWLPPPTRREEAELLDSPGEHATHLGASLAEVRRVNRYLGGAALVLGFLRSRPELRPGTRATVLDVATGTADIPLALLAWARGRGVHLEATATDVSPEVLGHARAHAGAAPGLTLEVADALRLPYPDASFDYAVCNLALHHFGPEDATEVLREMWRVARRAILVNDLRRSRPGYWGARLLFLTATRNPLCVHDGPLSVLRAYTDQEVRALAEDAGLRGVRVRPRPVFRLELTAEKGGRPPPGQP